jgi:hypothetical protein
VLLLRALDERLGLTAGFAERVPDWRDPRFVQHPRLEQLRQRVYQIALGYEDCNDATRLRNDRAFKVACDRLPEDEAGLSSQPTLSRMENAVPMSRVIAQAWYEHTGEPARRFRWFQHKAGKWSHARRVIGKAEHLPDGANPRFVVTNLTEDDEQVYLTYCGRGQAENYIKAFKNAVRGDRLSCSSFAANFLRGLVHALAYRLLHALRAQVQPMNQPQMQFDTLRIRLLKVAAIITQSARRILVRLPMCFPAREMFMDAALRVSCPAPS